MQQLIKWYLVTQVERNHAAIPNLTDRGTAVGPHGYWAPGTCSVVPQVTFKDIIFMQQAEFVRLKLRKNAMQEYKARTALLSQLQNTMLLD